MEIEQRIYLGNRAKEVLENEAYTSAITTIKQEITDQWQNSPARDQEGREKLWMMLKLAEKLELTLKSTMETGKLAQLDLAHQKSLLERARGLLSTE